MPQADEPRREVFDVRLDTSLDVGKASKSEDIDIALIIHFVSSGNAQLTIIGQEGVLIAVRPIVETSLSLSLLSQRCNMEHASCTTAPNAT
jgi:hypothetical protein